MSDQQRRAAQALRERAAHLLDDAAQLDGDPAMRVLITDLRRIAAAADIDPEFLVDATLTLYDHEEKP